ncbi:hypothetical protein Q9L42_008785 [Methylomarinum sp. Ch1-1]|uniref:Uncharacterized protein n=1 Tax=Methylomarinum roseum TaxID=3067653 RepID=A0AAU7P0A7_9GAMM|nr:hypothetical protein [Methylomarinum sp. Ch1-1]MDP4521673.1 hypothetical protein [Methylomarinum sp. Ch1-1]
MQLSFPEEDPIKAKELSYYLYYFSAAYTVAVERYGDISLKKVLGDQEFYVNDFRQALFEAGTKSPHALRQLFFSDLSENELVVDEITRNSPLSFFGKGVVSAIVLSAIISGGKVEGFGVKVEMQPLGEGVKLLKEAFKEPPEPEPEENNTPMMGM